MAGHKSSHRPKVIKTRKTRLIKTKKGRKK